MCTESSEALERQIVFGFKGDGYVVGSKLYARAKFFDRVTEGFEGESFTRVGFTAVAEKPPQVPGALP